MSTLLERFEQELLLRGYATNTRRAYVGVLRTVERHFGRELETLTLDDIRAWQMHLTAERGVAWATFNIHVLALRKFFRDIVGRDWDLRRIPYQRKRRRLPTVLTTDEVAALLATVTNLKHRALLLTTYGCGLRVSELTHLQVTDIDSSAGILRVQQGKGFRDRCVALPQALLPPLRAYWRRDRPRTWLFPGPDPTHPLHTVTVSRVVRRAARVAGIQKRVSPHTLRHSYATHLRQAGRPIELIQLALGHRNPRTTAIYIHLAADHLRELGSPLDTLPLTPAARGA